MALPLDYNSSRLQLQAEAVDTLSAHTSFPWLRGLHVDPGSIFNRTVPPKADGHLALLSVMD